MKQSNELFKFFIGIILLGAGLFLLMNQVSVSSSWSGSSFFRIGSFSLANGAVTIPLIIGIVMMFYNPKSVAAKILITLGAVFIVISIIMSIHIRFERTSLYIYLLIFGLIASGAGMVLRVLFKNNN